MLLSNNEKLENLYARISNKHGIDRDFLKGMVNDLFAQVRRTINSDEFKFVAIWNFVSFVPSIKRIKKRLKTIEAIEKKVQRGDLKLADDAKERYEELKKTLNDNLNLLVKNKRKRNDPAISA